MKSIDELTKKDIANLKLVVFDVDGVIVKKGTDIKEVKTEESSTLTVKTNNLIDEMLQKLLALKERYVIAINSGRSLLYLTKNYYDLLWDNAALLAENGIFTLYQGEVIQHEKFKPRMLKKMRNIFVDLKTLEGRNKDFRAFEPKQFLITLHAWNEIQEVYEIVKRHDKEEELYTWWNGEAFDIAPKWLNKGQALKNFAEHLKIDIKDTMAIGNGINDKHMTDAAGIGVTTEPKALKADYYTNQEQDLGGADLVDHLLSLV